MNTSGGNTLKVTKSWDTYWQGIVDEAAYSAGGIHHPLLKKFWEHFFRNAVSADRRPRCLDIACGNGAVVEFCQATLGAGNSEITCVDIAEGAIASITRRFPGVSGIVADATKIPLESASFDYVSSQFGVEYAGDGAMTEAARLVRPGGRLGLLVHHSGGSIFRDCAASLAAIRATQEARFIPLAIRLFETGFAACNGGDRAPYDAAGVALNPAVKAIEGILDKHGHHVADDTIRRLYCDVADIHGSIQKYTPDEVIDWLQRMDTELDAFAGRMASMCESALDEPAFQATVQALVESGLAIDSAAPLAPPGDKPLAWAITAFRP
jgi:SAM-dependent methyltransferase